MEEEVEPQKHKPALSINRLPEQTRADFIKLANDEFCGDYGMTLKALFDEHVLFKKLGLISVDQRVRKIEEAIKMEAEDEVKTDGQVSTD